MPHHQTLTEYRQEILNAYIAAHPDQQDWMMEDAAVWAINEGLWTPTPKSMMKLCARELADAARVEYHEDPQGRRVRSKYPVRTMTTVDGVPRQKVFWEDYKNLSPSHMHANLQQRRTGILADCAQLKRDTDSYNDNNPHGAHVQMEFDFTADLAELEASDEYPESPDHPSPDDHDPDEE